MTLSPTIAISYLKWTCVCPTPSTKPCASCVDKSNLISLFVQKIDKLGMKPKCTKVAVREGAFRSTSHFTWTKIKTDRKVNYLHWDFIMIFEALFLLRQDILNHCMTKLQPGIIISTTPLLSFWLVLHLHIISVGCIPWTMFRSIYNQW